MQETLEISALESLKGTLKKKKGINDIFFQFICSRIKGESLDNSEAFYTEVSGHSKCVNKTQW